MPIYEYVCTACGHELEQLQKVSDPLLRDCPACGDETLNKKVSAAAFRLKGGGWYETDFKSDGKRNLASESGAEDKKASQGSKKSTEKSETAKPASSSQGKDSASKSSPAKSESKSSTKKAAVAD